MTYEVTCEGMSGYRSTVQTEYAARMACAGLLEVEIEDMVEISVDSDCPGGLETWCYASQADADGGKGGYGPSYRLIADTASA